MIQRIFFNQAARSLFLGFFFWEGHTIVCGHDAGKNDKWTIERLNYRDVRKHEKCIFSISLTKLANTVPVHGKQKYIIRSKIK